MVDAKRHGRRDIDSSSIIFSSSKMFDSNSAEFSSPSTSRKWVLYTAIAGLKCCSCFEYCTVKLLLSYGVAASWLMASREGVSGTRQLAHASSFWPVIGTSYILHVPALSTIREVSLHIGLLVVYQLPAGPFLQR